MRILITGTAGFIGFHLARRLLAEGHTVTGFDGLTDYYDPRLKRARHALLERSERFAAHIGMLEDKDALERAVADAAPEMVVHLAAQAGVRYSIENPQSYVGANVVGTFNLLEAARAAKPRHLLIASTSSIYAGNRQMPFAEADRTDFPLTIYGATKKATEAMSHAYAHLWSMPTTCFRFFTVYGPWGRPDMALFRFVSAIERDEPIEVYGEGRMLRDFTYIDDLVEGICRLMETPPEAGRPVSAEGVVDSLSPLAPWRSVNIAGGRPVGLLEFIAAVEAALGKTATRILLPLQKGDPVETFADNRLLQALTGFVPRTELAVGVRAFVDWYRSEGRQVLGG